MARLVGDRRSSAWCLQSASPRLPNLTIFACPSCLIVLSTHAGAAQLSHVRLGALEGMLVEALMDGRSADHFEIDRV